MDDRKKTLAALTIVVGVVLLVLIVIGTLVSGRSITSPVPESGAIRIIFTSPTPIPAVSPTPTPEP